MRQNPLLTRRAVASGLVTLPLAVSPQRLFAQAAGIAATAAAAREAQGLPAIAFLAARDGVVLETAAVGLRARDSGAAVTEGDRWHIGSCAKSMTATLIARLVERGRMGWDTPLAELLPQVQPIHPETARITLYEIMTMRSGLPGNPVGGLTIGQMKNGLQAIQAAAADDRARRLLVAQRMLASPPKKPPGTAFAYSNTSYLLLGAIIEAAHDDSYDRVIARELFEPLQIADFGFGAPGSAGAVDQPLGHQARSKGLPVPPQSPDSDLPSFMRPAGGINMTLAAWLRFVTDHVAGEKGGGKLLSPASYARLHSRPGANFPYGGGWGIGSSGRRLLSHFGNNTYFSAMVEAYPDTGHVFLFACNDGRDGASVKAFEKIGAELSAKYLGAPTG